MTKTFCDGCGVEAAQPYLDVSMQISGGKFQLRAIFEHVREPAACGSIGLSSATTTSADICPACQLKLVEKLKLNIRVPL